MTTDAPSAAMRTAIAWPIPDEEPVITATLPARRLGTAYLAEAASSVESLAVCVGGVVGVWVVLMWDLSRDRAVWMPRTSGRNVQAAFFFPDAVLWLCSTLSWRSFLACSRVRLRSAERFLPARLR